MASPSEHELFWESFRYAHDELSPGEREAFELRLSGEQTAREALAQVVLLAESVRAAGPSVAAGGPSVAVPEPAVTLASRSGSWRQAAAWVGVGVAACVVVMFALQSMFPGGAEQVSPLGAEQVSPLGAEQVLPVAATEDAGRLAQAWVETQSSLVVDEQVVLAEDEAALAIDEGSLLAFDPLVANEADDALTPSWLIAAVATSADQGPQEN